MTEEHKDKNLLTLVPNRIREFEMEGEKAVILLPRFSSGWPSRHIQPRLKKPTMRVRLDEIGTMVWQLVDGKRTVMEITELIGERFGKRVIPPHERVGIFITMMKNEGMIKLEDPEDVS
ncbi:MAG: PqqD family protein [Acidobacteria bacterium CG_4_9_14_3_um_filter_49_7]|nr:MAG: PqqD family protein [Acidobacteria bacterium CG_4_9_14_3_um_filter_49_7]